MCCSLRCLQLPNWMPLFQQSGSQMAAQKRELVSPWLKKQKSWQIKTAEANRLNVNRCLPLSSSRGWEEALCLEALWYRSLSRLQLLWALRVLLAKKKKTNGLSLSFFVCLVCLFYFFSLIMQCCNKRWGNKAVRGWLFLEEFPPNQNTQRKKNFPCNRDRLTNVHPDAISIPLLSWRGKKDSSWRKPLV